MLPPVHAEVVPPGAIVGVAGYGFMIIAVAAEVMEQPERVVVTV